MRRVSNAEDSNAQNLIRTMKSVISAFAFLVFAMPAWANGDPQFQKLPPSSGIDHTYSGEWEYMVGGGAAAFDCNDDGFDDVFLAGGDKDAAFFKNTTKPGGDVSFERHISGLEFDRVTGAYPIDIDSDKVMDLVLLRVGENIVMRGKGNCQFENANAAWHFDGGDGWSTAFAATWEKGKAWPTLAIGNYIDRTQEISPWGSCTDNWLHRPAAAEPGFTKPVSLTPSFCPLSMMFTDWNRSGTPSLRVSNDREYYEGGQEQMWHVEPGQAPRLYTEAEGWQRVRIWGMGIASYDLNFDGFPEYFLTSMADNRLQSLANVPEGGQVAKPVYKEVALAKGVTAHRPYTGTDLKPSTAWHTQFEDVNNDGFADLFIAKGNVWDMPDFAREDPNNLLIQKPDGTFRETGDISGVASMLSARGAVMSDFNLDGKIDLLVVNRNEPAELWQNVTASSGEWIQIRPEQEKSNTTAIGAWIEVKLGNKILRREVISGGGHMSGQAGWWHFGLGSIEMAEIRILWPDGMATDWMPLKSRGFYVWNRESGVSQWFPK
jgi:enediyne biosynthesis protein E4